MLPVSAEHRVVKNYSGQSSTQMSLKVGDVVIVVEALDSGWWLGCHGDQVGWFPGDHVEVSVKSGQLDQATPSEVSRQTLRHQR